ncbi:MAG: methyltransferase domain-containing protein [Chloroflexi bacterium]|nr:methyltransferase domain-containing protein [Chloroflexota bacterium]
MHLVRHPASSDLFADTASYYARYRVPYPEQLIAIIADAFHLDGTGRLLDVGCGTGQLSLPLSARFQKVVGIDVSPEMTAEARRQGMAAGIENVCWRVLPAEQITLELGSFRLVTFGASFHWMDRATVLERCHLVLEPGGGIVVAAIPSFWNGANDWEQAVVAVVQRWLGKERRAGSGVFVSPTERHEETLARSGFSDVERNEIRFRHTWDIPSIAGHLYSTSYCKRAWLSERLQDFEEDLRKTLVALDPAGRFEQEIPLEYIFAWKR